jgi:hypothetical protein
MVCQIPDGGPGIDAYSPGVVSRQPTNGGNIDPSQPILATFDTDVLNVNESTFTVNATGSTLFAVGTVTYIPEVRQARFFNPEGLPPNAQLTATLTSDIVAVDTGLPLMPTTWDFFTLGDSTPPSVTSSAPFQNQTNVPVGANVSAHFSEPVINTTGSTISLMDVGAVQGAVTYDFPSRTAVFDPTDQLLPNTAYTFRVTSGVTDASGNALLPSFTLNFMTGADTLVPHVRATNPMNTDTNIAVTSNVIVTFDEAVMNVDTTSFQLNGGAIAGTVTMSANNKTATFDPTADLPAATMITVTLGAAITDTSSNPLVPFMFVFTTQ